MANPLSVKGTARMVEELLDDTMEAAKKAAKVQGAKVTITARYAQAGQYGFDKDGKLGFVGNVVVSLPLPVAGVPVSVGVQPSAGSEWDSNGTGTLEIEVTITASIGG
jgi:hypothetical protein